MGEVEEGVVNVLEKNMLSSEEIKQCIIIQIQILHTPLLVSDNTELSICTTHGSYDGKTPNVASSPRRLSGPLRVVALGGPTEDKFDACAHE